MAETDEDWALYADHRAHLTEAIAASANQAKPASGRLCVLGAGKCNDVDLVRLAETFVEIHLVDIDAGALGHAVARQTPEVRTRLRPHALVDLSGVSKRLPKWKRRPPTVPQLEANADATLQSVVARLPGPFDVVVSACVLTQMAFAARDALGDAHPMLQFVRLSVTATHLNTMVALTAVGGTSLFVTDLVSSTVFPLDELPAQAHAPGRLDLRGWMDRIVASGTAYHSANPSVVRGVLGGPALAPFIDEPELLEPWLWTGGKGRTYFVYAMRIPRRA
jgi:hypothetical protein